MLTIEKLKEFGADTEDGLRRCINMEDFYLELVKTVLEDTQLDQLESELSDGKLDRAFEISHALKGVYSNLSLTPLVDPIVKMTELLRAGTQTDYSPLMGEAKGAFERLKALSE